MSDHPPGGVQASRRNTKMACSKHVIFDIVKLVYDGSMEVDDRPRVRRTLHGMGHDISPPRDCDSTVFPASLLRFLGAQKASSCISREFISICLVIHTGKWQPVFIWREEPVLLALLSNLTIPVPASYPVFCIKWCEMNWVIFCGTNFWSTFFPFFCPRSLHKPRTWQLSVTQRLRREVTAVARRQNLRGGAQLFPRHTTCPRSHELLVSSHTNYLPSSLSTRNLLIWFNLLLLLERVV